MCISAKRIRRKAALGHVLVQSRVESDKLKVFKAKGRQAGTSIGMSDDLTQLMQQRKNLSWPKRKFWKGLDSKTQWRAEKLIILALCALCA